MANGLDQPYLGASSMSIISDVLTGGVGTIIESVGKLAGEFVTTDKERLSAELELKKLGLDETKAYLADTDSARKMQIAALAQDDLFSKRFVYFFIMGWSAFAMLFMCVVTLVEIPQENTSTVSTILGFLLGTAVASIFSFLLGTSRSSQKKDSTIQSLAANK